MGAAISQLKLGKANACGLMWPGFITVTQAMNEIIKFESADHNHDKIWRFRAQSWERSQDAHKCAIFNVLKQEASFIWTCFFILLG